MAEALLSASLQVLFDRLASGEVLNFIQRQKLSGDLLDILKIKLLTVHAVLNDAEVKQFSNSEIKQWLFLAKDAVYHAEDLLDEIATEALQWEMEAADSQTGPSQVWSWVKAPFSVQSMASRVKEMIGRLEAISNATHKLGLKEGDGEKLSPRSPSTSSVDESGVFGRDEIKEEIIVKQLLVDNFRGNPIDVISIVGMGGSGKTTLAQLLHTDERVKRHFELKPWVYVSTEFHLVRITKLILEEIGFQSNTDNLNKLQEELRERLDNKKLLLVLDDVWDTIKGIDDWDKLLTSLQAAAQGSKIVVTTRLKNVASFMAAVYTHDLGGLCFEDCWSLFKKVAFSSRDSTSYPQLEPRGRQIVDKCQGLPLAVKAVGNLLRSKADEREWDNILNSEIWDFKLDDGLLPSLLLSYHHLPLHLKRCFAYCSLFPKGHEFDKEMLILLWMAEGLLQTKRGSSERMEEVGDQYFHELVEKSFFQKSTTKEYCFIMHDLIHDLAQHVSGEFCIQLEGDKLHQVSDKARHLLYFQSGWYRNLVGFKRYESVTKAKYLRTFLELKMIYHCPKHVLSKRVLEDIIPKMKCLHVLSLAEYKLTNLPDSICNLKYLRYLDLSYTTIEKLPESICYLYNLQTMMLERCMSLIELPSRMGTLINLRYLNISGADKLREMPSKFGQLKSLQRLSDFIVGQKSGSRIGELREVSNIGGTLRISGMQNIEYVKDAIEANMKDKRYLDGLSMVWNSNTTDGVMQNGGRDDLLSKFQPHPNLRRLEIRGYPGVTFPDWVGDPSFFNLVFLKLWNCENCSSLPPLGQLRSLKELQISRMKGVKRVGGEFYGNGFSSFKPSFPSLETLTFEEMDNWEKWLCCGGRRGEFPCLQKLRISKCPKLSGKLPKKLRSLKTLEIVECPNLLVASLAVPAISELQLRSYGELQLKKPSFGFTALGTSVIAISNLFQWKQLPVEPRELSIEEWDSAESTFGEGFLKTNTSLVQGLTITDFTFSKALHKIGSPNALKRLRIYRCVKLEFLLPELLRCHHPFLEELEIKSGAFSEPLSITFSLTSFPRLTSLFISELKGLEHLSTFTSEGEGDTTSLVHFTIFDCPNLVYIELPTFRLEIWDCLKLKLLKHTNSSMEGLYLSNCPELLFPRDGLPSNLRGLTIYGCSQLTPQVDWGLQRMASLIRFEISGGYEDVESFPQECLLPSTLTSLHIWDLPNLKSLDSKGLQRLSSLRVLEIRNCPRLESLTGSCLQHLLSLETLYIDRCSELQSSTEAGLQHLTSLEELDIQDCPKLQYLTKQRLPASLSYLKIRECPLLEKRCQFGKGKDWHYISHIPSIMINDVLF